MITRTWHGRTRPEKGDQYLAFLLEEGTRDYLKTEGNLSVKVWRKKEEDACHFWTVTEWRDIASVKSFAGEAYEKARYYPQDKGMLLEFEETVNHYESVDASSTKCRDYWRQLDQVYHGGSWQGESYVGKLEDVDEGLAFTQPFPGVHSIAEIVWHCLYWRRVTIKRLEGDYRYRDETVERYNFLPVEDLRKRGWKSLTRELEDTQIVLQKILLVNNDNFLKQEYAPGYTYDYQVEGCIHHDVYHLGQIGLVKKILSAQLQNT
ncbi:MAG TPA: DinB family protein [Chryseosolibacter sp.]|nr:DinB family protein [Chryseosolibacter sp.]